ncbi:hypothetical protein Daesc_006492 [Daldinia eschscholtzii]|uniref:Rhodopsin domain-containing protein n=1 Tax=Daldinia eschscholtzii TaxID=292717 RepID=A0AAX6MHR6_9PEZI
MEAPETIDHTQITILLTVSTVLTGISDAAVVVVTRSWIRFFVMKKAGLDDWMSVGALIVTIGYLAILYVGKAKGMGSPMATIAMEDREALLQISKRSRHVLYGIFGVGGLATAFSCARLYSIHTYTLAADPFRDSILVNVWSMVEVNVAIWCASAPALKPLFSPRRFLDSGKSTSRNYHNLNHPGLSQKGVDGSTSQSHIVPVHSDNYSASPRGSSHGPEEIELERPRQAHV